MFHFEHHLTHIWNTSTHDGNNGEHEFVYNYVLPSVCVCDLYDVYNFIMYTLIGLEHSFLR